MKVLLLGICFLLLFQLVFVIWNLRQMPRLRQSSNYPTHQKISVLIPARNEAARIEKCLESIVSQGVQPFEVLVLDDNSTDDTAQIIQKWSKKFPIIKLLKGQELKEGWIGKSYACHQLAKAARGDWFLFLDADVRLCSGALQAVSVAANDQRTGMISGFPKQKVVSWLEKLVVPMMMFTIACHLPIKYVRNSQDPKFSAAHGGFILIEKACYEGIGGHSNIRNHLVDDLELAKLVKRNGYPFQLVAITDIANIRMYDKAADVWKGYRKNIYPGMNRNVFILISVLSYYVVLYLVPVTTFIYGLTMGEINLLAFVASFLGISVKGFIDKYNGLPWWYGFSTPISILFVILISLDSMRVDLLKKGYDWKGRSYL